MVRLRKRVDHDEALETELRESSDVPRERRRLARDVDDTGWCVFVQRGGHVLVAAVAGRIEQHDVRIDGRKLAG